MNRRHLFALTATLLVALSGAAAALTTQLAGPPGVADVDPGLEAALGFVQELIATTHDERLGKNERALQLVEQASRQQLALAGLEWRDEVDTPEHGSPSEAIRALSETLNGRIGPKQETALAEMDALPPALQDALAGVIDAFHGLHLAVATAYDDADMDYLQTLQDHPEAAPQDGSWLQEAGVNLAGAFAARLQLVAASLQLKEALQEEDTEVPSLLVPAGHDDGLLEVYNDAIAPICINCHNEDSSTEPNTYEDDYTLLIDTSNADKFYRNNAGGNHPGIGHVSALIDTGGNNEYGNEDFNGGVNGGAVANTLIFAGISSGNLLSLGEGNGLFRGGDKGINGGANAQDGGGGDVALGFLLTMGGNDEFIAGDQGVNGGAIQGTSRSAFWMLLNMEGDDRYVAEGDQGVNGGAHSTGAGPAVGLLVDVEGMDYYQDLTITQENEDMADQILNGGANTVCLDDGGRCEYDNASNSCWNCSVVPKRTHGPNLLDRVGFGAQIDLPDPPADVQEPGGVDLVEAENDEQVGLPGARLEEPFRVTLLGEDSLTGYEVCFELDEAALEEGAVLDFGDVESEDGCVEGPGEAWLTLGGKEMVYETHAWVRIAEGVELDEDDDKVTFTAQAVELTDLRVVLGGDAVAEVTTEARNEANALNFIANGIGESEEGDEISLDVNVTWTLQGVGQLDLPEEAPWGQSVGYNSTGTGQAVLTAHHEASGESRDVQIVVVPAGLAEFVVQDESGQEAIEVTLFSGDQVTLSTKGYDEFGNPRSENPLVEWRLDNGDLGELDPTGSSSSTTFSAKGVGEGTILAEPVDPGVDDVEVTVRVNHGTLASIRVYSAPGGADGEGELLSTETLGPFTAGDSLELYAAGYDINDNFIGDLNGLNLFSWKTVPQDLGSFNEMNNNLTFERAGGNVAITAEYGKEDGNGDPVTSEPVTISLVHPASPHELGFSEPSPRAGDLFSIEVQVLDAFGNHNDTGEHDGAEVSLGLEDGSDEFEWQSGTLEQGKVTFDDLYYTVAEKITLSASTTIGAPDDGSQTLEGAAQITIRPNDLVALKLLDGADREGPFVATAGSPLSLHAEGYDEYGNRVEDNVVVTWHLDGEELGDDTEWEFTFTRLDEHQVEIDHAVGSVASLIEVVPADLHEIVILDAEQGMGDPVTELKGLTAGTPVVLIAAAYDAHGNWIADVNDEIEWTVEPRTLGGFNRAGDLFTPGKRGDGTIQATYGGDDPVGIDPIQVEVAHHGPPGELVFISTSPDPEEGYIAGEPWDSVEVLVEDGFGNHVEDDDSTWVTLSLGEHGYEGALNGTTKRQARNGVVVFNDISYTVADEVWIVVRAEAPTQELRASHGPYVIHPAELDRFEVRSGGGGTGMTLDHVTRKAGDSLKLHAAGYDGYGNFREDVEVRWSVQPEEAGVFASNVTAAATFIPHRAGQATITATYPDGTITDPASISVEITPGSLSRIQIRDASGGGGDGLEIVEIGAGNKTELYAAGYDAFGNFIRDTPASWRLDPSRLGSFSPAQHTANTTLTAAEGGTGRIVVNPADIPGDHEIPLRVTTQTVPPLAAIQVDCSGLTCTFDASGSTPGTTPIDTYEWDLGDGNTQQGQTVTHTYQEPGDYEIALKITDAAGLTAQTSRTAPVRAPPGPEITMEVSTHPDAPRPGDAITAIATIQNSGEVALLQFSVVFTVDDALVREQAYPRLEAGETMSVSATWSAREGDHVLHVEIPSHVTEVQTIHVSPVDTQRGNLTVEESPGATWLAPVGFLTVVIVALSRAARWRPSNPGVCRNPR